MNAKFLGCLSAFSLWLFASCTSEDINNATGPQGTPDSDEVEVTFAVKATGLGLSRAADDNKGGAGQFQEVGRGSKIDMLIYAVYDEIHDSDGNVMGYSLLSQYAQGLVSGPNAATTLGPAATIDAQNPHEGQTIINVGTTFANGGSETIKLRLMRNKVYHIAFWAQSSYTNAYNTNNLEKVEVNYEGLNNDELRDAFSKVESFSVAPGKETRTVILTRPLAQINVGTSIYDFNNLVDTPDKEDKNAPDPATSAYTLGFSRIELHGVAKFFNVLADNIIRSGENGALAPSDTTSASFTLGIIPSYWTKTELPVDFDFKTTNESDEEFLFIDFNNDGVITEQDDITVPPASINDVEKFKYLSMCYVLVPDKKNRVPLYDGTTDDTTDDSVIYDGTLSSLQFYMAKRGDGSANDEFVVHVPDVPVRRNMRTNLLSTDILTQKVLWRSPTFTFQVDTDFEGEYNSDPSTGNDWQQANGNHNNE